MVCSEGELHLVPRGHERELRAAEELVGEEDIDGAGQEHRARLIGGLRGEEHHFGVHRGSRQTRDVCLQVERGQKRLPRPPGAAHRLPARCEGSARGQEPLLDDGCRPLQLYDLEFVLGVLIVSFAAGLHRRCRARKRARALAQNEVRLVAGSRSWAGLCPGIAARGSRYVQRPRGLGGGKRELHVLPSPRLGLLHHHPRQAHVHRVAHGVQARVPYRRPARARDHVAHPKVEVSALRYVELHGDGLGSRRCAWHRASRAPPALPPHLTRERRPTGELHLPDLLAHLRCFFRYEVRHARELLRVDRAGG